MAWNPTWYIRARGPSSRPCACSTATYGRLYQAVVSPTNAVSSSFGSLADARHFCQRFFDYYNHHHRHSGLGWHTPASVHDGTAKQIRAQRGVTLDAAYQANPARFTRRPQAPELPQTAWINQPSREALIQTA